MIEALYDEPSGINHNYHREVSSCFLTDGNEFILGLKEQKKSSNLSKNKVLHVPSSQSFIIHASKRNFS